MFELLRQFRDENAVYTYAVYDVWQIMTMENFSSSMATVQLKTA